MSCDMYRKYIVRFWGMFDVSNGQRMMRASVISFGMIFDCVCDDG